MQNAAPIHWVANNRKSDTPKEFVNLKPNEKDWFTEKQFIKCVKDFGIWVMLGKTPCNLEAQAVEDLKKIEEAIKGYEPKARKSGEKTGEKPERKKK